jgi:signal peptidase I
MVLGLALGLVLALVLPLPFGARPFAVLSGSMEPTLRTGDVVVSRRISPLEARVGDVVTFHDPDRGGVLVTHRVRRVRAAGGKVVFVTRGDANNASERWRIDSDGELSRAVYRIPAVGRVLIAARTRGGLLLLVVLPLLLVGAWEMREIWRDA